MFYGLCSWYFTIKRIKKLYLESRNFYDYDLRVSYSSAEPLLPLCFHKNVTEKNNKEYYNRKSDRKRINKIYLYIPTYI